MGKYNVYAQLEYTVFRLLTEFANSQGCSISDAIEILLSEALQRVDNIPETEKQLLVAYSKHIRQQQYKDMVLAMVRDSLETNDEERLAEVLEIAQNLGMDPDGIMAVANELVQRGIEKTHNKTAQRAIHWLAKLLAESKEIPATVVYDLASQENISTSVLKQAKEALKVKSERRSKHWVWKLA